MQPPIGRALHLQDCQFGRETRWYLRESAIGYKCLSVTTENAISKYFLVHVNSCIVKDLVVNFSSHRSLDAK